MSINDYAKSKTYYELFEEGAFCRCSASNCSKARVSSLKALFKILGMLPLVVFFKAYKTVARFLGVILGLLFFMCSLGFSSGVRSFLEKRVLSFSRDMIDWVVFPFAVGGSLAKLLLAAVTRPSLFFRF